MEAKPFVPVETPDAPKPFESVTQRGDAVPFEADNTKGWWNLSGLHGTRAGVLKAIGENAKVPSHWKAAIAMEINSLDAKFNLLTLDAHFHIHEGRSSLHISIVPKAGLV